MNSGWRPDLNKFYQAIVPAGTFGGVSTLIVFLSLRNKPDCNEKHANEERVRTCNGKQGWMKPRTTALAFQKTAKKFPRQTYEVTPLLPAFQTSEVARYLSSIIMHRITVRISVCIIYRRNLVIGWRKTRRSAQCHAQFVTCWVRCF